MNREVRLALGWGCVVIPLAIGAKLAHQASMIDADTVKRLVFGINGIMSAWYGNRIPKTVVPHAQARNAQRVAGWMLTLSGLLYTALWAVAPIRFAVIVGTGAVFAGIAVTFGYCLSLRSKPTAAR